MVLAAGIIGALPVPASREVGHYFERGLWESLKFIAFQTSPVSIPS